MADDGRDTRLIPVKDRQVVVRQLRDAQYGLLVREANAVKRIAPTAASPVDDDGRKRITRSMDLIMRTFASAVVQEEDREYLDELIADGELEMSDLFAIIRAFKDEPEEAPVPAKPRRGRPPKRVS